jgi:hypothetical protein
LPVALWPDMLLRHLAGWVMVGLRKSECSTLPPEGIRAQEKQVGFAQQ